MEGPESWAVWQLWKPPQAVPVLTTSGAAQERKAGTAGDPVAQAAGQAAWVETGARSAPPNPARNHNMDLRRRDRLARRINGSS
jgi:hypothetical protein